MKSQEKKNHGLEHEPLGNEDQRPGDKPKSFDDKRPADPEIPKGDHPNTDTSRSPTDWKKQLDE